MLEKLKNGFILTEKSPHSVPNETSFDAIPALSPVA
jgi:hypothetical protein